MTVSNFPLLIAQGQEACQRMSVGASSLDAINALMAEGPYSFVTANTATAVPASVPTLVNVSAAALVNSPSRPSG